MNEWFKGSSLYSAFRLSVQTMKKVVNNTWMKFIMLYKLNWTWFENLQYDLKLKKNVYPLYLYSIIQITQL